MRFHAGDPNRPNWDPDRHGFWRHDYGSARALWREARRILEQRIGTYFARMTLFLRIEPGRLPRAFLDRYAPHGPLPPGIDPETTVNVAYVVPTRDLIDLAFRAPPDLREVLDLANGPGPIWRSVTPDDIAEVLGFDVAESEQG